MISLMSSWFFSAKPMVCSQVSSSSSAAPSAMSALAQSRLAVVNRPLAFDERRALIRVLLDRTPEAPLKGIEMSVVTEAAMRDFRHPPADLI